MPENFTIVTRKIQLLVDSSDGAYIHQVLQTVRNWQHLCRQAANFIVSHRYLQEQLPEMVYLSSGAQTTLADNLATSQMNSTYQLLSHKFKGQLPMHIISCLNCVLVSLYNKERAALLSGDRSLRHYRHPMPVPIKGTDIVRLQSVGREFSFQLFRIPLRTYLGKDEDKRILLQQTIAGEVQLCSSSLLVEDGKLFLLACFKQPIRPLTLNSEVLAEASLSLEYPISLKIGKHRYNIGTKESFLHRRLSIQAARQRLQQSVTNSRGGHGRKRKLKALEKLQGAEANYIRTELHRYSKKLIDLCIRHGAATLLLVHQTEKETAAKEDAFVLRNWNYYELKEMIAYKAQRAGIVLLSE